MLTIETEIAIGAPPADVWDVLMDFAAYPSWNPFVRTISGDPHVGSTLVVSIALPGGNPMKLKPTVLVCDSAAKLSWVGKLFIRGIFDGEHQFILEAAEGGGTRFLHRETFSGILSGLIFKMIGDKTTAGFEAMNAALKERAEGLEN